MSFFPVPIVRPRLYTRHILELWEYQWNGGRQTYERVCYTPVQVTEPENNPIDSIVGMNLYPNQRILFEDLDREVQELMRASRPTRLDVRSETPLPLPPTTATKLWKEEGFDSWRQQSPHCGGFYKSCKLPS